MFLIIPGDLKGVDRNRIKIVFLQIVKQVFFLIIFRYILAVANFSTPTVSWYNYTSKDKVTVCRSKKSLKNILNASTIIFLDCQLTLGPDPPLLTP